MSIKIEFSKLTSRIKTINGVKPLVTINNYVSSYASPIDKEGISLRYFAVVGDLGCVVDMCTLNDKKECNLYTLLDRETAIVFFNMMESACFETYRLPMIKQNKLLKRFKKQVTLLEKIQPGIMDESNMTGACSCCCCEECGNDPAISAEEYYDELEKERITEELINELSAKYYGIAKSIIEECDDSVGLVLSENTSPEIKSTIINAIFEDMKNKLSKMYDSILEDAGREEKIIGPVTDYVTQFVKKYRTNLGLE